MDFKSTYTLESVSMPGVIITLRRMGPRRRAEVELSVAAGRARQRELSMQHELVRKRLIPEIDKSPKDADGKPIESLLTPEALELGMELQDVSDQAAAVARSLIHPAFVREALKSFGGTEKLTYDGKPASAELLCEVGPDDLFDEVVMAVNSNGYLAAKEAAPLQSRTISVGAGDGTGTNSTAPDASLEETSLPAVV